jgi:hypothetical protein
MILTQHLKARRWYFNLSSPIGNIQFKLFSPKMDTPTNKPPTDQSHIYSMMLLKKKKNCPTFQLKFLTEYINTRKK